MKEVHSVEDNTKKTMDWFGLTDIDKIQADIEKDLTKPAKPIKMDIDGKAGTYDSSDISGVTTEIKAEIKTETEIEFDPLAPTPFEYDSSTKTEVNPLDPVPFEYDPFNIPLISSYATTTTTKDTHDFSKEFYSDEFSEHHKPHAQGFALSRIIILVLVFTLGTGTLGFGVGSGGVWLQQRLGNGINDVNSGNTIVENPIFNISRLEFVHDNEANGSLADIVEYISPAVVTVTAVSRGSGFDAVGSGVIFAETDERVYIVTNHYVVQGRTPSVTIDGSVPLAVRPIHADADANLAIMAVYKSQLLSVGIDSVTVATFGDSEQMRVGDTVIAIGNAMGAGNSVTRGVISAPVQFIRLPQARRSLPVMQTDAAINEGNSGGPLINMRGEVIGINMNAVSSLIFGRDQVEGMGYTIPSNAVVEVLEHLLVLPTRPAIGITGHTLPYEAASRMGIPPIGVFVYTVMPNRAADREGIIPGDIITGFDGLPIFDLGDLLAAIALRQIGDTVEVNIIRDGNTFHTFRLELMPNSIDNF